jgi:hypothetical protein
LLPTYCCCCHYTDDNARNRTRANATRRAVSGWRGDWRSAIATVSTIVAAISRLANPNRSFRNGDVNHVRIALYIAINIVSEEKEDVLFVRDS